MNIESVLSEATAILKEAGVTEREAASLLCFVLDKPNSFLIAHPEYELTGEESATFRSFVRRRAKHEPFQYITRRQEFWGLEFEVSPGVLIPRPETEILVEEAIKVLSEKGLPSFCEVGVGSGCISVSILHSVLNARAIATDISPAAIDVAQSNAAKHAVADRLDLLECSFFGDVTGIFDLVVSNPPYIPDAEIGDLQPEVSNFEPHTALAGGRSGLDLIEQIIEQAPAYLNEKGVILIEIGFGQAAPIRKLFARQIWSEPDFLLDLQGIPRIAKVSRCPA